MMRTEKKFSSQLHVAGEAFGDKLPAKKETLAGKRREKIKKWRLSHLRSRFSRFSSQRWVVALEWLSLTILFLVNLWLLLPFFGHEDQTNVFSAPVIPVLAMATKPFISFSHGIRTWLLIFLVLFPFSLYYFVKEISGRKLIGILSTSVVILPVGFLLPVRVTLGLLAEDGAHIASLTLTLFVCLLLLRFLRKGYFWNGIFASLGATLVALTSPLGLLVLGVFMGIITFSEMLLGQGRLKMIRFLLVLIFVIGFSAFWYNPKFVILTFQSSQGELMRRTFFNLLPVSFFLVPILGVFGFLLFENRPQLQPMFIASFLTVTFGLFSLGAGITHALPSRFLPAFGISFSFFAGILTVWLFDFLRVSSQLARFKFLFSHRQPVAFGTIAAVFLLMILTTIFSSKRFRQSGDLKVLGLTSEQKAGIWEKREEVSRLESTFGYLITGLTTIGVGILKTKLNQEE